MDNSTAVSLQLEIIAGRGLASKDRNGFSDPYCTIWFEDEKGVKDRASKRKTAVMKKTLNPVWKNESFSYVLLSKHKTLVIQCWDKDRIGKDFMGEIVIPLHDLGGSCKQGWIALQQKRGAKKTEKVSGELNISLTISEEKRPNDLNDRQAAARTINLLFDRTLSALDIYCEMSCNFTDKTPTFGCIIAAKDALYFYTERKRGRRKALELSWWDIVDISTSGDTMTVSIGLKAKTYKFEDFVESEGNTIQGIINAWEKQSRLTKPDKKKSRLSLGSIGKKKGKLKTMKDHTSTSDSNIVEQLADITDYTEVSEPSFDENSDHSEEHDLRLSIETAQPIAKGVLQEKKSAVPCLPTTPSGTIITNQKSPPMIHFIAKRMESKHNPGLTSVFVKLVECQFIPEQPYGAPNVFVETKIGPQLYISAVEPSDRHPVFGEEYVMEVNTAKHPLLSFSVFHRPEGGNSVLVGEFVMTIRDLENEELVTVRKDLSGKPTATHTVDVGNSTRAPVLGRIQANICFNAGQKSLIGHITKYQVISGSTEGFILKVDIGEKVFKTKPLQGSVVLLDDKFQFEDIAKGNILTLRVCLKSEKTIGHLNLPVVELNRELPNIWFEIPAISTFEDKPQKPKAKSEKLKEQIRSPVKFSPASFEDDAPLQEEKPAKIPLQASSDPPVRATNTSDIKTSAQTATETATKGIDKTYIVAGLATFFFLLALLYKWFF